MLVRIILITAFLVMMSWGGWATYTHMMLIPIQPVMYLSAEPGGTYEIKIQDLIKGHVVEHQLNQLTGSAITIAAIDAGYRVSLPRLARGEALTLELSAASKINQATVSIKIVTTFIGQISDIVIGNDALCLIDQYGPFCWGGDSHGQSSQLPTRFTNKAQLFAGNRYFCGIEDNQLSCWGDITLDIKLRNLTAIDAGNAGVCLIDNGILKCYSAGGVQDITHNIPQFHLSERANISVGLRHACILDTGAVYCWGHNYFGQTKPPIDLIYPTRLVSGDTYSCALDSGQIRCWGRVQFEARMPALERIDDIKANGIRLCARSDDRWHCWVINSGRSIHYRNTTYAATNHLRIFQSGICSVEDGGLDCDSLLHPIPHTVKSPHHLRQNGHIACFIDKGRIHCMGEDQESMQRYLIAEHKGSVKTFEFDDRNGRYCAQFTNNVTQCFGNFHNMPPPRIDANVTDFDINNFICVLHDNNAECIGDDNSRKLSSPPTLIKPEKIQVSVNQGMGETIKSSFACALDQHTLQCWGDNNQGQLDIPKLADPIDFDLAMESGCAISKTATACWGNPRYIPKTIPATLINASSISVMHHKACIIDAGKPICVPAQEKKMIPALLDTVYELKAGISKNCAINTSGVTCWGDQYFRYGIENSEDNLK